MQQAYPGPGYYHHAPQQQQQQQPGAPPLAPVLQQVPPANPPPPAVAEDADRIEKSANYVARNGLQFEQVLREKQVANPKFQFLSPAGEHYHYYRHVLNCLMNGGWTLDQVAQVRNQHYQQHPPVAHPGTLTAEEAATLHGLLNALNGSKDSITTGREWIIQHAAKGTAAMAMLRDRAQAIQQEPPVSGPAGPDGVPPVPSTTGAFTRILYLIYVVNDVLFRAVPTGDGASDLRELTYPHLATILRAAQLTASSDEDKEKVGKVATLWGQKQIYDEARVALLLDAATGSNPIEAPPSLPGQLHAAPGAPYQLPQPALPQVVAVSYPPQPAFGAAPAPPPPLGTYPMGDLRASGMIPPPLGGFPPPPQLGSGIVPPPGNSWPTAPAPMQTVPQDLNTMPVGVLVGLVKVAMQNGHKKYAPLDLAAIPPQMPQPIEPARLEARVSEYYRRMPSRSGRESGGRRDRERGYSRRDEDRDSRDRSRDSYRRDEYDDRRDDRRRHDYDRDRDRDRDYDRRDRDRDRDPGRYTQPEPTVSKDRALEEDNVGHQMLKGMGWKEGSGLGSKGSGIAAPIDDGGQGARDKGGVGSRSGTSSDMVEQYRQMRSKGYHDKIVHG